MAWVQVVNGRRGGGGGNNKIISMTIITSNIALHIIINLHVYMIKPISHTQYNINSITLLCGECLEIIMIIDIKYTSISVALFSTMNCNKGLFNKFSVTR